MMSGPMSFSKLRSVSLPYECALRSGSAESSRFFSLMVWIRFSTVRPNCSSLTLYSWAMSVSLKTGALSSSLFMSFKNATSSAKAMPCRQESYHHCLWVQPAWLCCTVNADSGDGTWPQWQSCLLLQAWPTEQCPQVQGHTSTHLCQCCRLMHYVCLQNQQAHCRRNK